MASSTLRIIIETLKKGGGEKEVSNALMGIVGSLTAVGVATAVFGTLVAATKTAIAAASETETAVTKLTGTMMSMGRGGEDATKGILKTASALMQISTFDDETIIGAYTALAKFDSLDTKGMDGIVKAAMDMTAVMGGDLPANAEAIGRILETGLVPKTMAFSSALKEQVKGLIESGDKSKALEIILGELNQRYGGQAVAQLNTYAGSQAALKNAMGEFWEAVGAGLVGPGQAFNNWLTENVNRMTTGITAQQAFTRAREMGMNVFFDQINGYYELNGHMITAQELIAKVTTAEEEQAAAFATANPEIGRATTYLENMGVAAANLPKVIEEFSAQYSAVSDLAQTFAQSDKDLADAEKELADLRAAGWDETSDAIVKAKGKIEDIKAASQAQTDQWMLNLLTQQLSVNGLTQAEMNFLLQYQVDTGLISKENAARASDLWTKATDMTNALNSVPSNVPVIFDFQVNDDLFTSSEGEMVRAYFNGTANPPEITTTIKTDAQKFLDAVDMLKNDFKNKSITAKANVSFSGDLLRYDFLIATSGFTGGGSINTNTDAKSEGGPLEGWGLVGDMPGGILTPFTELVYAPQGAMVYSAAETRKMLGRSSGGLISGRTTTTFAPPSTPMSLITRGTPGGVAGLNNRENPNNVGESVAPVVEGAVTQLQAITQSSMQSNEATTAAIVQSNSELVGIMNSMLSYIKDQPQTFARAVLTEGQSGWNG